MPLKNGSLTPNEQRFAEVYAKTQNLEAARSAAGYTKKSSAPHVALKNEGVQKEIARLQHERINNELLPMAVDVLYQIMIDTKTASNTRLGAAKYVIDRALPVNEDGSSKQPHEMTPDELSAAIDRLTEQAAAKAKPIEEAQVIEDSAQDVPNVFA